MNDSRCTPSKLAKVSLASASLVYMYIGLLEYADAWQQSAADRKVVDFTKKKLFEVDQLSRSKKLFESNQDADNVQHMFRQQLTTNLTSALRRSAAIHTVLSGSSLLGSSPNSANNANGKRKNKSKNQNLNRAKMTMREKLIENPFPRVRHKKGWKGSPSSNRGISFSSSANHFIINIQEIPRSLPKIPPFLYTLPENEQEKKIKEKNNNLKNN